MPSHAKLQNIIFSYFRKKLLFEPKIILSLQSEKQGSLAEWLGTGLQNRLHRFNSGRRLQFLRAPLWIKPETLAIERGFVIAARRSPVAQW